MKNYYRIADAFFQLGLLAVCAYGVLTEADWMYFYWFAFAAWFIASLWVHFVISSPKYQKAYRNFAFACIAVAASLICSFFVIYLVIAELYIYQYLLPILAAAYTFTCFLEIIHLRKRPISYLK